MQFSIESKSEMTGFAPRARKVRAAYCIALTAGLLLQAQAWAATPAEAEKLYRTGQYAECQDACAKAIEAGEVGDRWWILKTRSELAVGHYDDALKTCLAGIDRYDGSLDLRLLSYEALRRNDRPAEAMAALAALQSTAESMSWRYNGAADQVIIGRAHLLGGTDARKVLEQYYDKAKKSAPELPDAYVATGELALLKQDYAIAAEAFAEAVKCAPDDPDIFLGLARSFPNDAEQATAALAKALELNPRHVESLLLQADDYLDREVYDKSESFVKMALEVNPKDARAWSYRAALAHLAGDRKLEVAYRDLALATWKSNPEVDYLVGLKLSQHYRFAEGAAHQRQALAFVPTFRPAKAQLSQDLLRLGKEDEAWALAAEVFKEDPYSVLAYNMVTLHDSIAKFRTLESPHFVVRMDPGEAQIYGQRVLRLLEQARKTLCAKYDVQLPESTIIEIFPQQKDFAIRTFGLPGGADFLGVCFGPVVTVNSPASRMAHPSNWEAVVWHEFCHSVTLGKTRNRMPRWLSEGISVYEESLANAAWGQRMTPEFRTLILAGSATPVSKLSSAFLAPPSPMHLMFAYYESSMVVEYVNKQFGAAALRNVLADLGNDSSINEALARHTEPMDQLDAHFAAWLKRRAEELAPQVDWTRLKLPAETDAGGTVAALAAWNKEHPNSFAGLVAEGQVFLSAQKWAEAKVPLEKAIALYPEYADDDGPYPLLAAVYRELGETRNEQRVLAQYVARNADALDGRLRLTELAAASKDWAEVSWQAQQALAINPLIPAPHQQLAKAAEAIGDRPLAIEAYRTLLQLDPLDRAEQHYHLAKLLFDQQLLPQARREVLLALEEAPRYRAAHSLLLRIAARMDPPAIPPAQTLPAMAPPHGATPGGNVSNAAP